MNAKPHVFLCSLVIGLAAYLQLALGANLVGTGALTNGLIAFFPFEGNSNDESGSANNATPSAKNVSYIDGQNGQAVRLKGDGSLFYSTGGHLLLPTFTDTLSNQVTVSFWAKDEALGGSPVNEEAYVCLGAEGSRGIQIQLNSVLKGVRFLAFDSAAPKSAEIVQPIQWQDYIGRWKHVAITHDGIRFKAYLDGQLVGDVDAAFFISPILKASIGRHWWSAGGASSARMSATIDSFRIYNRALSVEEIGRLFRFERDGQLPDQDLDGLSD